MELTSRYSRRQLSKAGSLAQGTKKKKVKNGKDLYLLRLLGHAQLREETSTIDARLDGLSVLFQRIVCPAFGPDHSNFVHTEA